MKYYSVTIKAFSTMIVKAKDHSEAIEIGLDTVSLGRHLQMDEAMANPIKGQEAIRSALRHADAVQYELESKQKEAIANPFGKKGGQP